MHTSSNRRVFWGVCIFGAIYLAITMGLRQTVGLYVPPLQSQGFDIVTISLAIAIGQLIWGLIQPIAGAIADRFGHLRVLIVGAILLFFGIVLTPFWLTPIGLIVTFGFIAPLGSGAGSFSTLIGVSSNALPAHQRSLSTGIINAGGSFGQFIYAPFIQALISSFGLIYAFIISAFTALVAIPTAWLMKFFAKQKSLAVKHPSPTTTSITPPPTSPTHSPESLRLALKQAFSTRDYWLVHLGFLTCGFHVAFLVTHLKVEVVTCHGFEASVAAISLASIGLFNIAGSLLAGYMGERIKMKNILAMIYGTRALIVLVYLFVPKTEWTFYIFAAALGLTWLATVPPTAGIVGKNFGVRYLATLFGMTLVSHQIGGFFGAYLGGIVMQTQGNYLWMWYVDILLALFAALVSLPIKEPPPTLKLRPYAQPLTQ